MDCSRGGVRYNRLGLLLGFWVVDVYSARHYFLPNIRLLVLLLFILYKKIFFRFFGGIVTFVGISQA